jgi:hypothetical protein
MIIPLRQGIVVLRRRDWAIFESARRRPIARGLTLDEVVRRYRGIDGLLWPEEANLSGLAIRDGLVPLDAVSDVRRYVAALRAGSTGGLPVEVLACSFGPGSISSLGGRLIGWDAGYLDSETGIFSAVLHDVLCGRHEALNGMASLLNDDLLFGDPATAQACLDRRAALIADGHDLENDDPMTVIRVEDLE